MSDPDKPPKIIRIETRIIERMISAEARRRGVMTRGLRVGLMKDNKGNRFLVVSGEASALKGSASQGKQIITDVVKKYTVGLNINTASLKLMPTKR